MIEWIASVQPLVIAALLTWAGVVKLRGLRTPEEVSRSAIGRIVGDERASLTWRMVGGVELLIAAGLLLPAPHPAKPAAAALLAVGFLGFLWYARRAAPESSCGCLSARPSRVSWRSFGRAGLLLALSGLAAGLATSWWPVALSAGPLAVGVVAVELAGFVMLSPELDHRWLWPLRQLKVRLTHPLAGPARAVPLLASVEQVQASDAYRQVGTMITSDVLDSWEQGEWRILEYAARRDGEPVTAVFAVPLHRHAPEAVRVALIDRESELTMA